MRPFDEGEACHESQLDHYDRQAVGDEPAINVPRLSSQMGEPIAARQIVIALPRRERSQDFSARKTTDWRHILTTIGFKCDDGIIGTRGFFVVNTCSAGI